MIELQRTAGNRAVTDLVVQRRKTSSVNNGGSVEVDGYPKVPIQGATFGFVGRVVTDSRGRSHLAQINGTPLEIVRSSDRHSATVAKMIRDGVLGEGRAVNGQVTLTKPSARGAIEQGSMSLFSMQVESFSRNKRNKTERFSCSVETARMSAKGNDYPTPDQAALNTERGPGPVAIEDYEFDGNQLRATMPLGPRAMQFAQAIVNAEEKVGPVHVDDPDGAPPPFPEAMVESAVVKGSGGDNLMEVTFHTVEKRRRSGEELEIGKPQR